MSERDVKMFILGAVLTLGVRWAVEHPDKAAHALDQLTELSLLVVDALAEGLDDPVVTEFLREQAEVALIQQGQLSQG